METATTGQRARSGTGHTALLAGQKAPRVTMAITATTAALLTTMEEATGKEEATMEGATPKAEATMEETTGKAEAIMEGAMAKAMTGADRGCVFEGHPPHLYVYCHPLQSAMNRV